MSKKTVNIFVFSIGLFMFLLRPYVICHITGYRHANKNPVKTRLLQRMVKKKDEHYECPENNVIELGRSKFSLLPPIRRLAYRSFHGSTQVVISFLASSTGPFRFLLSRQSIRRLCLLSCFRI